MRCFPFKERILLEKFVINGGTRLCGEVTISGAKNAVVAIIPAAILAQDVCLIENIPNISDVTMIIRILQQMGAKVRVRDCTAYVEGVPNLSGAEVYAKDLRGGASLVLAGLCANGYTTVNDIYHIERGYCDLDLRLNELGADIRKEI